MPELFAPLVKIDVAQRLVYGRAAEQKPDKIREVFDYASSKPLFEKWSSDIEKASGGKSLGNVRAMHGKIAAGKLAQITFDDSARAVDICAKVVDDNEWQKVLEGVYTGFSIGGGYARKWADPDYEGCTRYTAAPSEISIVDNPCAYGSHFTMIKADGMREEILFKSVLEPTNAEIEAKAIELHKVAGTGSPPDYLDAAREALMKGPTANDREEGAEGAGVKEKSEEEAEGEEVESEKERVGEGEGDEPKEGAKDGEGGEDGNSKPEAEKADWGIDQVFQVRADGSIHLTKQAAKEHVNAAKVLAAGDTPFAKAIRETLALTKAAPAEDAGNVALEKLEAEHAEALAKAVAEAKAGVAATEAALAAALEKIEDLTAERDGLNKAQMDAIPAMEEIQKAMKAMREELDKLKDSPRPMPNLRVVEKADETPGGGGGSQEMTQAEAEAFLKSMSPEELQKAVMRMSLSKPVTIAARA